MELVYVLNIQQKNVENLNLCFSNEYALEPIQKRKDNSNFSLFNKNIKLNVIAGENGSGKSAILEHIYNFSNMSYFYEEKENNSTHGGSDFIVFKKDTNLYLKGDKYGIYDTMFNNELELKIHDETLNCSLINHNNEVLNTDSLPEINNFFKTLKVLLKKFDILEYFDEKFIFKNLKISFKREDINQFNSKKIEGIKFFDNLKEKIKVLIENNVEEITYREKNSNYNKKTMFTTKNIEFELKITYFINYLGSLQGRFQDNSAIEFLNSHQNFFDELTFENMFDLIISFNEKINEQDIFHTSYEEEILSIKLLIENLSKLYKKNSNKFTMQSQYIYYNEFFIDYETSVQLNFKEDSSVILPILEELKKIEYSDFFELINFDLLSYDNNTSFSSLSSGEKSLINKFMLIFYEIIFNYSEIILLDEPDTLLHPNWSKVFIKKLLKILENDSTLKTYNIHIILTTHSPFLLSDIPKENIIFLKNGKQEYPFKDNQQTFGANIHTLLSHGFFMEDGLMGEYAKEKINEVIQILKKDSLSSDEIKTCKDIISIIGEPILQKTLQSQLDMKLYPKETQLEKLEREQREIQIKIDELKKKNETD